VNDYVGHGLDLEPPTLLAAYLQGMFPMPDPDHPGRLDWFSPDPRGVMPLDRMRVTGSLRRSCRRFRITVDQAFDEVIAGCGDPARPGGWINEEFRNAYRRLFDLGRAHSVEVWSADDRLAGGLYGVSVNGFFAGESMFHRAPDASKVALVALVRILTADGVTGRLLDVQWATDHLVSLGVVEVSRDAYLRLLATALERPSPVWEPPDLRPGA
jgi:leucyl/phenylalanyl-tRNA---protein transferase